VGRYEGNISWSILM